MKCPVCKLDAGTYKEQPTLISDEAVNLVRAGLLDPAKLATELMEMPLYQKSYKGEPEHISPRCSRCFDKAEKMMERKREKRLNRGPC